METHEKTLEPPRISRYTTKRCLGAGGSGNVWVLQDDVTGQEVVLKVVPYDETFRQDNAQYLEMHHEFLVEQLGFVETSQGPGLLMEYCPAGSAAAVVSARGPLSVGEMMTVIAPMAEVLQHLHEQGMTHGDLSPRNILFTAEGKPKLGDFGNRSIRGETPTDYGTSGFCAPEVARRADSGELEPARDVYGLAACAWYLLTGRAPVQAINRIPIGAVVPEVNDELAMLLEDGLAEDPERRPTAGQFAQRIFVGGTPAAVELGDAVEPEALKHMLTTRQTLPRRWFFSRAQGTGSTSQQRRLRSRKAMPSGKAPDQEKLDDRPRGDDQQKLWAKSHKIRPRVHGKKKLAVAVLLGMAFVGAGAVAAQSIGSPGLQEENNQTRGREEVNVGVEAGKESGGPSKSAIAAEELLVTATDLTLRRDGFLMAGDVAGLETIYVPGSPALERDKEVLVLLKRNGLNIRSLQTRLAEAFVDEHTDAGKSLVRATSIQSGYAYVDASGKALLTARSAQKQEIKIEMRGGAKAWKIWDVTPADTNRN